MTETLAFDIPPRRYSTMPPYEGPAFNAGIKAGEFRGYCRDHCRVTMDKPASFDQPGLFEEHVRDNHKEPRIVTSWKLKRNAAWKAPTQKAFVLSQRWSVGADVALPDGRMAQVWSPTTIPRQVWVVPYEPIERECAVLLQMDPKWSSRTRIVETRTRKAP